MSKKQGFTIAELMVASAMLVMLLAGFLAAFNSILKTANYSEGLSLAYVACLSKLEEIISHDFNTIRRDYGPGGTPGWTFTPAGLNGLGNIRIADRRELYGGGEWTVTPSAPWVTRDIPASVVYDNRMWIMGGVNYDSGMGFLNDVWSSTDGINWTFVGNAPWSGRFAFPCLVYGNKMWVLGGGWFLNDIWYSNDGINWTTTGNAPWSGRAGQTALVYDNKMWVMGGFDGTYLDDVWYSTNGLTWTQVATQPPMWAGRYVHTALVYDNRMWILGGYNGTYLNDVWSSNDGIHWTPTVAGWSERFGHTSVVYDNRMWVMGGAWGGDEVWCSTDGTTWWTVTDAALWGTRQDHASLVYDSRMWIFGGFTTGGLRNDVWNSAGYDRLLEVVITVCWRQRDGRVFGEDGSTDWTLLNGNIDPGEDLNNNGQVDSPAQLRFLLSEKDMLNLRRTFLGRP